MGKKDSKTFPNKRKDLEFLTKPPTDDVRKKITKILDFSNKFEITDVHNEKISVVHFAAVRANPKTFRCFLRHPEINFKIDDKTETGITALHLAVKAENLKAVEALIEKCADVNAAEKTNGYTPLHYSCKVNNLGSVKLLVENGAKIEIKDLTHRKAWHLTTSDPIKNYFQEHRSKLQSREKVQELDKCLCETKKRVDKLEKDHYSRVDKLEKKVLNLQKEVRHKRESESHERDQSAGAAQRHSVASRDSGNSSYKSSVDPDQYPDIAFMSKRKRRIQECYHILLQNMSKPEKITTHLYTQHLIETPRRQLIENQATCEGKTKMILDLVMQGDRTVYEAFLTSLYMTNQWEILNLLEEKETSHLDHYNSVSARGMAMTSKYYKPSSGSGIPTSSVLYPKQPLNKSPGFCGSGSFGQPNDTPLFQYQPPSQSLSDPNLTTSAVYRSSDHGSTTRGYYPHNKLEQQQWQEQHQPQKQQPQPLNENIHVRRVPGSREQFRQNRENNHPNVVPLHNERNSFHLPDGGYRTRQADLSHHCDYGYGKLPETTQHW